MLRPPRPPAFDWDRYVTLPAGLFLVAGYFLLPLLRPGPWQTGLGVLWLTVAAVALVGKAIAGQESPAVASG